MLKLREAYILKHVGEDNAVTYYTGSWTTPHLQDAKLYTKDEADAEMARISKSLATRSTVVLYADEFLPKDSGLNSGDLMAAMMRG